MIIRRAMDKLGLMMSRICPRIILAITLLVLGSIASRAELDNQGKALGVKVKGDLGEGMMDVFYRSSGYERLDCSVGNNGIDGLYVLRNEDGVIKNVITVECKTDVAKLGRLDNKTGPYQLSREYNMRKIDCKIAALNKLEKTPEVANQIHDLQVCRNYVEHDIYRRQLFKMDHVIENGRTCLKMQTSNAVFENGSMSKPVLASAGKPVYVDMQSADSALSKYHLGLRNEYYSKFTDIIMEKSARGSYGIKAKLTSAQATEITLKLKNAYESGAVSSKMQLIEFVAEELRIDRAAATECVEGLGSIGIGEQATSLLGRFRSSLARSQPVRLYDSLKARYNGYVSDVSRRLAVDAGRTFKNVYTPEALKAIDGVTASRNVVGVVQELTFKDGVKTYVLSIPVENYAAGINAGIGAGIMTFIFAEGVTGYRFAKGEISQEDFCWESGRNCSSAILGGTATFVAVVLGATPSGWLVMGVGVGSCLICDMAFKSLRKAVDGPGFNMEDVLGLLPTELQRNSSALDFSGYDALFDYGGQTSSIMDYHGNSTIFENASGAGAFDFEGESMFDK